MTDWILSILMLAGAALTVGGIYTIRKGENRKQGFLMLIAAVVMFLNVGIWSIPVPEQNAPEAESAD